MSEAYPELTQEKPSQQPQPQALQGRTILVTGAGDGIGVHGQDLALYGANVILLGKPDQCSRAYSTGSAAHLCSACDCAGRPEQLTPESAETLRDSIEQTYALHGIVHNASLLGPRYPSNITPMNG